MGGAWIEYDKIHLSKRDKEKPYKQTKKKRTVRNMIYLWKAAAAAVEKHLFIALIKIYAGRKINETRDQHKLEIKHTTEIILWEISSPKLFCFPPNRPFNLNSFGINMIVLSLLI